MSIESPRTTQEKIGWAKRAATLLTSQKQHWRRLADRWAEAAVSRRSLGRLVRLEDRILHDAGFAATVAGLLELNGFEAGDSLAVGQENGLGSVEFRLSNGRWDAGDLVAGGPFSLSGDGRTLFVGPAAFTDVAIQASGAPLASVDDFGTGLVADRVQINGAGRVRMDNLGTAVRELDLVANEVSWNQVVDIHLSRLDVEQNAELVSRGAVTNSDFATVHVDGQATITGESVVLGTSGSDDIRFGSLSLVSQRDAVIHADTSLILDSVQADSNLELQSTAEISNTARANLRVDGDLSLKAGKINLGTQATDTVRTGRLEFQAADVRFAEDGQLTLTGTNTADTLLLQSDTTLSQQDMAELNVSGNARFEALDIRLGIEAGDLAAVTQLSWSAETVFLQLDRPVVVDQSFAVQAELDVVGSVTGTTDGVVDIQGSSLTLTASDSIQLQTDLQDLTIGLTGPGNIRIRDIGDLKIHSLTTAAGDAAVTTAGMLDLQAGEVAGQAVLEGESGSLFVDSLRAARDVRITAVDGELTFNHLISDGGDAEIRSLTSDVRVGLLELAAADQRAELAAGANLVDGNGSLPNAAINGSAGQLILKAGQDTGLAGVNVHKDAAADPLEVQAAQVKVDSLGAAALSLLNESTLTEVRAESLWVSSANLVRINAPAMQVGQASFVLPGNSLDLKHPFAVAKGLHIEAAEVTASAGGVPQLTAQELSLIVTADQAVVAGLPAGAVSGAMDLAAAANLEVTAQGDFSLTDLDCSGAAAQVQNGELKIVSDFTVGQTTVDSESGQASILQVQQLALQGSGDFELQRSDNQVDVLSGHVTGTVALQERDGLQVGATRSIVGLRGSPARISIDSGGPLTVSEAMNVGGADVRLESNGTLSQSAAGAVTADRLLVRQSGVTGDIQLESLNNRVRVFTAENRADGGDVSFTAASDVEIGQISSADQIAGGEGIRAIGGDIRVEVAGNLHVVADVITRDGVVDQAGPGGEEIRLSAGDNLILGADHGTLEISTDELPGQSFDGTSDQILLTAGTNGTLPADLDADGVLNADDDDLDGDGIDNQADGQVDGAERGVVQIAGVLTVATDGGVAHDFGPRPVVGEAGTAFFERPDVLQPIAIDNSRAVWANANSYLNAFLVQAGTGGEENLVLTADWGDPAEEPGLGLDGPTQLAARQAGVDLRVTSERFQRVILPDGGIEYTVGHVYTTPDLTLFQQKLGLTEIPIDFRISHHESIRMLGEVIQQNNAAEFVGSGLLSSTDDTERVDGEFDSGRALFVIPTVTPPPALLAGEELLPPPERPQPVIAESTVSVDVRPAMPLIPGPAGGNAFGTTVYFQVRRRFFADVESEVIIPRLNNGDFLSSGESLARFVQSRDVLQDGAGYEVWLITETRGQRAEQPVAEFDITGGRPAPSSESMPETVPGESLQLQMIEGSTGEETGRAPASEEETPVRSSVSDDQISEVQKPAQSDWSAEEFMSRAAGSETPVDAERLLPEGGPAASGQDPIPVIDRLDQTASAALWCLRGGS